MAYLDNAGLSYFWQKLKGILATKADLNSPVFTGTPEAPTPAKSDSTTKVATTAFVQSAIGESAVNTESGKMIHVTDAKPTTVKALALYSSAGAALTGKTVAIANKNLFRIDLIASSSTSKGVKFTKNANGSITATGTSTGTYASTQCSIDKNAFVTGNTYTLSSGKTSGDLYVQVAVSYSDGTTDYIASRTQAAVFTIKKTVTAVTGSVQITASGVTINDTAYPQLELSGAASPFVNNEYNQITYNGSNLPALPATVSNVWSNNDDVSTIEMTYYTNTAAAHVESEARTTLLAVAKQDKLTAGNNITIDENTISATVPTKMSDLTDDSGYGNKISLMNDNVVALQSGIDDINSVLENLPSKITAGDNITFEEAEDEEGNPIVYIHASVDTQAIVNAVIAALPNGDEVSY